MTVLKVFPGNRSESLLIGLLLFLLGGMVPVQAQLFLTFSDNGDGRTKVVASGGTATAVASGTPPFALNAFGIYASSDVGFRGVDTSFNFSDFASIGFGFFDDPLVLVPGGMLGNGGITQYNFSSVQFGLLLAATADDGQTLSAIGAPDPMGIIPEDYSVFATLYGQTVTNTQDNFSFIFLAPPPVTDPAGPDMNAILAINSALTTGVVVPNVHSNSLRDFERTALNTLHNRRVIRARSSMSNPKLNDNSLGGSDRHLGRYLQFASAEGLTLKQALGLEDIPVSRSLSGGNEGQIVSTLEKAFSVEQPAGATLHSEPNRWEAFAEGDMGRYDGDALNAVDRGFDSRTEIGSFGVEYLVSPSLVVGAAYTVGENETHLSGGLGNVDIEGNLYSVYATAYHDGLYLDALYSYGDFENTLIRNTLVAGLATGTPDSDSHTFSLNAGMNMEYGNVVTGPTFGFDYISGEIDAYNETGGGFANLSYRARDYESAISSLGWQVSQTHSTKCGQLTLQGFTSWDHEFSPESGNIGAGLINFPGVLNVNQAGAAAGTDWMVLGAAMRLRTHSGWSFEIDYQTQLFRENAEVHYFGGRISAEF